jgi:acetylornithine deacetylase/succinyl-diaminopimelate desuccinylase-like protein
MTTKTVELAKQLIAITSFVSDTQNEAGVVDFLTTYVRKNLPQFTIKLSSIAGDNARKNIYLLGSKTPRLVFVGHIDTVCPSDGWQMDPLTPTTRGGKLYGLGAADMKGSIASLLVALQNINPQVLDEIAVLLYGDEEYQFAGMRQLVCDEIIARGQKPELIISLDGSLQVLSGCRGITKIDMEFIGRSGHASNPANGINAITGAMDVMRALESKLSAFKSSLGSPTMNIAYLRGGAAADSQNPVDLQRAGNVIPNYAECIIELRTTLPELNAGWVESVVRAECDRRNIEVKTFKPKIDLGVWPGSLASPMTKFIEQCYETVGVKYAQANPQYIGFVDVQMLAETIDSPTYVIGAGGENRHGANENVALADLEQTRKVYQTIITKLLR